MAASRRRMLQTLCLVCIAGRADAAPTPLPDAGSPSKPTNITLNDQQEQIQVWGHRQTFLLAPVPDGRLLEPGAQAGFGPGSRLGVVRIEGGPVHGAISDGVSAGLAVPVPGLKGLDFTASLAGTRDSLSPAGTTGAAAAVAGFRLRF